MMAWYAIAFGVGAILTAALNVIWTLRKKDGKWFRFLSLALTALTLCAFYSTGAIYVRAEDWSGALDVILPIEKVLWFLTAASICINGSTLFKKS